MPPRKPPREATLIEPDEATGREVMQLWHEVERLSRHGDVPTIRGGAPVQPQDEGSGLVEREWRKVVGRRPDRTLEGERVTATFLDPPGDLFGTVRRVSGVVARNEAEELVIRGEDGRETPVSRDAGVDRGRSR